VSLVGVPDCVVIGNPLTLVNYKLRVSWLRESRVRLVRARGERMRDERAHKVERGANGTASASRHVTRSIKVRSAPEQRDHARAS
jgi:hypothetical protein